MNLRTFLKATAAASAAALVRPSLGEAALPQAKITRIRFYEAPNVMPLQIPLLQSNMVVTIETDANITGIGEGGTPGFRPLPGPRGHGDHGPCETARQHHRAGAQPADVLPAGRLADHVVGVFQDTSAATIRGIAL
jgi:hypothetical protein